MDRWNNNELQFARLICEIVANVNLTQADADAIRDSMDLTREQFDELFDRANDVWERAKASV